MSKTLELRPAHVAWIPSRNIGRHVSKVNTEEQRNNLGALLASGWQPIYHVFAGRMSEADVTLALGEREAFHAFLRQSQINTDVVFQGKKYSLTPSEVLSAWEGEYFKNGKYIKPTHEGIFAYQRGGAIHIALAIRARLAKDGDPQPEPFTIPVIEKVYTDDSERIRDCVLENTSKVMGANMVNGHGPTLLNLAKEYRERMEASGKTCREVDIVNLVSGGSGKDNRHNGQKVHYVLQLDKRYGVLGLVEKVLTSKENTDSELFGQSFWKSLDINDLRSWEKDTRQSNTAEVIAEAEKLLKEKITNPTLGGKTPQAMKKSVITDLADSLANKLFAKILHAIAKNDSGTVREYEAYAAELNAVYEKHESAKKGHGPIAATDAEGERA